jgi:hypothetical protein
MVETIVVIIVAGAVIYLVAKEFITSFLVEKWKITYYNPDGTVNRVEEGEKPSLSGQLLGIVAIVIVIIILVLFFFKGKGKKAKFFFKGKGKKAKARRLRNK